MRSLLLGTTLLVAGTLGALAQAPEATAPGKAPEATAPGKAPEATAPGTAPVPAAPATLANDLRPTFVAQNPTDMVTSKLVGLTIQNGANETIGEIADVVLDEKSTVKSWVVGVGGFLGIGTKYVAIDPSALKLTRTNDTTLKATIDTNKDQLRAAPEYVYLGKAKTEAKTEANTKPAEPAKAP